MQSKSDETETIKKLDEKANIVYTPKPISRTMKNFLLIFSECTWLIVYLFPIIVYGFLFPEFHPAQTYISKKFEKSFDKNSDPLIFTHISDIHMDYSEILKINNTINLFKLAKSYKVDYHIISGDLVDSYGKIHWPKIGEQKKENKELFTKIVNKYFKNENVIDVAGNHEIWAILNPISEQNMFLNYSFTFNFNNTKTFNDYFLKVVNKYNTTYILINYYSFPSIHPPYLYWAHPNKKCLDIIEKEIEKYPNCSIVIHYPIDYFWYWVKSSSGKNIQQIMQNPKINYIYSGHRHVTKKKIFHHGQGGVEYCGLGAFHYKKFGIVTMDNNRHVYNVIEIDNPKKIFITNPVPLEEISSHQIFNEKKTQVRVISYYDKVINIYIKGEINGKLEYIRTLKNGAFLYAIDLNIEKEGQYEITIFNNDENKNYNFEETRKFYIGEKYKGVKEETLLCRRGFHYLRSSFIICLLILLIIHFPKNGYYIQSIDDYINGKTKNFSIIKILFLSPFILRYRIQQVHKIIRYSMFGFLLYSLICPLHIFKPVYGEIGFPFFVFTYIDGYVSYDEWACHFFFFYLMTIIFPATLYISTLPYKKSFAHYVNLIDVFVWWAGINVANYRWVGESVIVPFLFLNPTYVIIPFCIQIIVCKYGYPKQNSMENVVTPFTPITPITPNKFSKIKNGLIQNESK